MEMMAVDPLAFVVAPRFLAGVIAMPILACVFNGLGILGAPGRRELAGPGQRHVLVEHDRQCRCLGRRRQRRVEDNGLARSSR
jgi:hypothetical protein